MTNENLPNSQWADDIMTISRDHTVGTSRQTKGCPVKIFEAVEP